MGKNLKPKQDSLEIYDREVHIYKVPNVLSRASLFPAAEVLPDDQVLSRLKDSDFNIRKKVILSQESLSGQDPAIIRALTAANGPPFSDARISLYTPERVRVETNGEWAGSTHAQRHRLSRLACLREWQARADHSSRLLVSRCHRARRDKYGRVRL